MDEPCDICGDVGVFEAIITCCECKASREHLYCMSVVRTEVPPFWTCQECEHKKLISPFSFDEPKTETSSKKVSFVLESPKKPPLASRFHFKEKRVDKGRTQYLSCEEATKLSSGSNKPSKSPLRSVHGSPKSKPPPPPRERTLIKSPLRERTTQYERSKPLEPELKQSFCQQSASPNEKVTVPFTNKHDATPSIKSPERVRTPVSPSRDRTAKFEPHLRQPIVQQSTGLKEKVVLSFHNKGGATRSIKPPVRIKTLAELLRQESTIVKPDTQRPVVQESTGPKGDATPSRKSPACERMPIQKSEKAVPPSQNRARIEAVPPIKVADVGREIVMAKSPKEPKTPETNTGGKNHGDVEAQSSDAGKPNLTSGLLVSETNSPYIPSYLCYWTGVLFLTNRPENFNGEFRAHLPSNAHYKVFEMVKKMPENLYFHLIPRHEIWMGIFPHNRPDRDDIGLYFFPQFKKRSDNDISITDLLWKENLVMRSSVKGRELLVFSSRLLPSHSQELQGSSFLWGVFCCPKFLKKVAAPQLLLERKREPYDDVPPGFKRICEPYDDVPPGFKRICKT